MSTALRILLVLLVQTAALVVMIAERQIALSSPNVVTLKVVPVDPNDMYRGDYVALRYDISLLGEGRLSEDVFAAGDTIYVTLEHQSSGAWAPVALHRVMPAAEAGKVTLKGTITQATNCVRIYNPSLAAHAATSCPNGYVPATFDIRYGIESYFVPQGTGHAIEEETRKGGVSVDVAVDAKGHAVIKAMRRNGRIFYVEKLF